MRIGTVEISSKLALAPMAGVTDAAFRQICSELGAGYTITELISSKALCYHDKKTFSLLTQFPGEHPAAVQIFGSDPVCMAEAAQIAMEHTGADILDINMGCPMGKIVNNGDGAALMKDPELAGRIVEAVVKALPWRAGHGQVPPGLGSGSLQLCGVCSDSGAGGSGRRSGPWPHPGARSTAAPPTGTASGR